MEKIKYSTTKYTLEQIIAPTFIANHAMEHPNILRLLDRIIHGNDPENEEMLYKLNLITQSIPNVPIYTIKNIVKVYLSHIGEINSMSIDWAMWLNDVCDVTKSCTLYGYSIDSAVELCRMDGLGTLYGFQECPKLSVDEWDYEPMEKFKIIKGGKEN